MGKLSGQQIPLQTELFGILISRSQETNVQQQYFVGLIIKHSISPAAQNGFLMVIFKRKEACFFFSSIVLREKVEWRELEWSPDGLLDWCA